MRNTDIDWTSHVIVGDDSTGVESLRGRRIGFGDRDSPQAWILPAYGLRMEGLDPVRDITADRLDRDVGKHGDTGGAEIAQLARLRSGELDGTVLSAPTWANVKAAGEAEGLSIAWTTRPFHHCNFTVLDTDGPAHERFAELLGTMLPSEPDLEEPMRLEWVERWVPGDETGYADLIEAVREFA
jgi:ABC-type phosphate/phosphonate transport system substrate-binding protein